jgi:hypothetical protein
MHTNTKTIAHVQNMALFLNKKKIEISPKKEE